MTSSTRRGARRTLGLLACAMMLAATSGLAQERWQSGQPADPYRQQRPYQQQQPVPPPDGGSELRRNLQSVGTNPNNVAALIDSGRAALAMGDAQAALTFFSRADEVAPRDARIKAGMASAMTLLGQPRPALALFAEAQGLGAPELEVAADRGLAHDLLGDPRAAQRDYALVLRRRDNDETRRRLALSLAISGQREPALRLLEPQIRRNDRAGWRTQAFVLALTGDTAGAARVASGTGPAGTAEAMAPFLGRLPALSPAQRAMAVHLGVFPRDGRVQMAANVDTTPDPGALALAGGPARPPAPAAVAQQQARVAERPGLRRAREGAASPVERGAVRAPERERPRSFAERREGTYRIPGPNFPATTVRRVPPQPAVPPPAPEQTIAAQQTAAPPTTRFAPPPEEPVAPPVEQQQLVAPTPAQPAALQPPAEQQPPAVDASILAGVRPGDTIAAPGFSLTPSPAPAAPPSMLSERRNSALGDIAMVVNALPQDQGAARPGPSTRAQTPPSAPAAVEGRHWVQVAGNIDRTSMADELRRLRSRAPTLLGGMQGWAARTGATARLLVGPFGSARDAQSFVNQLRPRGIEAVAWSSGAGQMVERLSVPAASAQAGRTSPQRRSGASGARSESQQVAARSSRSARGRSEESRASTASRRGRNRGEEASATTGTRGTRSRAEDSRAAASSRNARGRGEETRTGASARNALGRTEPARTGGNARNSRGAAADTRATARSGSARNARPAAETRSNRGGSTVERRANDRDARSSRSRSAPEQRSSARGRRSD